MGPVGRPAAEINASSARPAGPLMGLVVLGPILTLLVRLRLPQPINVGARTRAVLVHSKDKNILAYIL